MYAMTRTPDFGIIAGCESGEDICTMRATRLASRVERTTLSRLARACARVPRKTMRRTEKTPSLVRSAAMFRGEDATRLDVLDEPLVRARQADATTISECTSRTALRLNLFLLTSLLFHV
jgi:hypothetical protein